jgi:hypothetical protein
MDSQKDKQNMGKLKKKKKKSNHSRELNRILTMRVNFPPTVLHQFRVVTFKFLLPNCNANKGNE